jgi:hypothetical protein
MPWSILSAEGMQATTCVPDDGAHTVLPAASVVLPPAIAWYATTRVVDTAAEGREGTIGRLCQGGEGTAPWWFLGLAPRDPLARIPRQPPLRIATTAGWEGRALQSGQVLVVCLPGRGGTHAAPRTRRRDHAAGVERLTRLLAAGVVRWGRGGGWAGDRSLRTSMPTRGDPGTRAGRLAARPRAHAAAVRAGRRSGWAPAGGNTAGRRGSPGGAGDGAMPKRWPGTS